MEEINKNNSVTTDEIDLIELFQKIWAERKIIFISIGVFFILGIIFIIGSPKEYKSETVLLIETSSKSGGMSGMLSQLGGLAGLAGLSGAGNADGITPTLYPDIIKSTPFLIEIVNQKVSDPKTDSLITVTKYFQNFYNLSFSEKVLKYSVGLPSVIISSFKTLDTTFKPQYKGEIHPLKQNACGKLSSRIIVKEGETAGILNVSVEMQDPIVAMQVTDSVVKSLTKYIISYRTQKEKIDLDFIEARFVEAKEKYIIAQKNLAWHRDQNKNVILASAKSEEERLQSEFNLASGIYNSLAQQVEQSKIKMQESTPVFKVIEPVKPNFEHVKPKNSLILVVMVFLGGFVGVGIVLVKMVKDSFIKTEKN